jgi:hypothetical protein
MFVIASCFKVIITTCLEFVSTTWQCSERFVKKSRHIIGALTLLFVAAYTIVTYNAFYAGYRALIYFDKATFDTLDIQVPPENNGKIVLSTRDMRVILDCRPVAYGDLLLADPFSHLKWDESVAHPEIVGPKQTITVGGGPCDIDPSLIFNAQMGVVPIILSGEIRYKDRVEWWPWGSHVTQFSQELVILSYDDKTNKIQATTRGIGMHNCADDDCPR